MLSINAKIVLYYIHLDVLLVKIATNAYLADQPTFLSVEPAFNAVKKFTNVFFAVLTFLMWFNVLNVRMDFIFKIINVNLVSISIIIVKLVHLKPVSIVCNLMV